MNTSKLEKFREFIRAMALEVGVVEAEKIFFDVLSENSHPPSLDTQIQCDLCSTCMITAKTFLSHTKLLRCQQCGNEAIEYRGSVRTMRSTSYADIKNITLRCYDTNGSERVIFFTTSYYLKAVELKSKDKFGIFIFREKNGDGGISLKITNYTINSTSLGYMNNSEVEQFLELFSVANDSYLRILPSQFDPILQKYLENCDVYIPKAIVLIKKIISETLSKENGIKKLAALYENSKIEDLEIYATINRENLNKKVGFLFYTGSSYNNKTTDICYIKELDRLTDIQQKNLLQARRPRKARNI